MIFDLKRNKDYPRYWKGKHYAVGVAYEPLGRYRIQFMYLIGLDNWQVMREWKSYKWDLIAKTLRNIFELLKEIDDSKPERYYGSHKHKEIVADFLPQERRGLLEE